jgi:hypothetical protein
VSRAVGSIGPCGTDEALTRFDLGDSAAGFRRQCLLLPRAEQAIRRSLMPECRLHHGDPAMLYRTPVPPLSQPLSRRVLQHTTASVGRIFGLMSWNGDVALLDGMRPDELRELGVRRSEKGNYDPLP